MLSNEREWGNEHRLSFEIQIIKLIYRYRVHTADHPFDDHHFYQIISISAILRNY